MTEYDLTLMTEEYQAEGWGICHWNIFPYCSLVWTKYESYILHTSAVMYTFQNLNTAVNDKVWPRQKVILRKGVILKGLTLR